MSEVANSVDDEVPEPAAEFKVILTQESIQRGLSNLMKTPGKFNILTKIDGSSFAFSYLNVEESNPLIQELVDVNEDSSNKGICALEKYNFIRILNLNKNAVSSIEKIKSLDFLFELSAAGNAITDINFMADSPQTLKYLQKIDLTQNKIKKLPQIQCPALKKLVLDENEITDCEIKGHPALEILSLNRNKLTSGAGLVGLRKVTELSITENVEMKSISGLEDFPALKKLRLTGSGIDSLADFPDLPALEELNLDGTKIADKEQFCHLSNLKNLKSLSAAEIPLGTEGGADVRKEVLIALMEDLPKLKTINGEGCDEDFLKDCKDEKAERIRAAEEAARAAAEAAANPEGAGDGEGND